jgi:hypothetical protein
MDPSGNDYLCLNRLSAYRSPTLVRVLGLGDGGMYGTQPLETLLEFWGKAFISFYLRQEERVAAIFRLFLEG